MDLCAQTLLNKKEPQAQKSSQPAFTVSQWTPSRMSLGRSRSMEGRGFIWVTGNLYLA